jgi:hypothetical protein
LFEKLDIANKRKYKKDRKELEITRKNFNKSKSLVEIDTALIIIDYEFKQGNPIEQLKQNTISSILKTP